MKVLILTVISFLSTFSNFSPTEKVISQSIPLDHRTMTIKTALKGDVEVVYVDQLDLEIETILLSSTSTAALDYAISAGHFKLVGHYTWETACLTLAEQRINTVVYSQGQAQQTRKRYRLKVPRHLKVIE